MSIQTKVKVSVSALVILFSSFFWFSSLSFFPIPWPDDSAFFLPGIEWINSPSKYRMHSQAPWVPTYDEANFNTMPFLPFLLGVGNQVGIDTLQGVRVYGVAVFAIWILFLFSFLNRYKVSLWVSLPIVFALLFSPNLRWGAMLVRPEIWQALVGSFLLFELARKEPRTWIISLVLAFAAYVHFEAFIWIVPVAIAVFPWESKEPKFTRWRKTLVEIFWKTLLFLSPWLVYLLFHWDLFWIQMDTQFGRLAEYENRYFVSLHSIFHSLFLDVGNPVQLPKFFNLAKILFWGLFVCSFCALIYKSIKEKRYRSIRLFSISAFLITFQLWYDKPEVWFITLIHATAWMMIAVLSLPSEGNGIERDSDRRGRFVLFPVLFTIAIVHFATTFWQWTSVRSTYSWENYTHWVDCIQRVIGDRKNVWQPSPPDVLVELGGRDESLDLTRHVDFPGVDDLVQTHAEESEVIIHGLQIPIDHPYVGRMYNGEAVSEDIDLLENYPWFTLRHYTAHTLGKPWKMQICHKGVFWAVVSYR